MPQDWPFYEIIVQGVGILGIIAGVLAFQCKSHKRLMALRTANELLFALQFFLLGAYTGLAMNLIGCCRNLLFAGLVAKKKSTLPGSIFFSLFFLAFTLLTWDGWISLLVGFAKVVSTFAYGNSKTSKVRLLIFTTSICWLIYNISVGSYAGAVCECLTLFSVFIGILRLDRRKTQPQHAEVAEVPEEATSA